MWNAIADFLLKLRASGVSHEAVIEIMIALLGVMVAVLAILSALVTLLFAALGFFGYKAIEEKSVQAAEIKVAAIAEKKIQEALADLREREQAQDLSLLQPAPEPKKSKLKNQRSSKKTTDAGLRGNGER